MPSFSRSNRSRYNAIALRRWKLADSFGSVSRLASFKKRCHAFRSTVTFTRIKGTLSLIQHGYSRVKRKVRSTSKSFLLPARRLCYSASDMGQVETAKDSVQRGRRYNVKRCRFCAAEDVPLMLHSRYKNQDGTEQQYFTCRPCQATRQRRYHASSLVIRATKKRLNKEVGPEKQRAWRLARCVPMVACEVCGTTQHLCRHHPDYSKPKEVVILCGVCHKAAHKLLTAKSDR